MSLIVYSKPDGRILIAKKGVSGPMEELETVKSYREGELLIWFAEIPDDPEA